MKDQLAKSLKARYLSVILPSIALLFFAGRCSLPVKPAEAGAQVRTVYVGTYTRSEGHVDGEAEGIYRIPVDLQSGEIGRQSLVAEVTNPSFLTTRKKNDVLFAVSELARQGEPTGYIHAYRISKNGPASEISRLPTDGKAPCHVALDQTEQYIVVSNYVGGVAKVYSVSKSGELEAVDKFIVPEAAKMGRDSWLHSANFSPDNETVAICDKGLDKVWLFRLDLKSGQLLPTDQVAVDLPKGSGPRHGEWSTDGRFLYVINELGNTISVLEKSAPGLTIKQTISTLPDHYEGASNCADIHLRPDGRFLYGSNRGHNSIAIFEVDPDTGLLTANGHQSTVGEYPRNFAISPNGRFLFAANQNTSNISTFRIDPSNGQLLQTGSDYDIPTPVCLEFLR